MWLNILQGTIEQGLIFGLLAMGVYLPFRILDFFRFDGGRQLPVGSGE